MATEWDYGRMAAGELTDRWHRVRPATLVASPAAPGSSEPSSAAPIRYLWVVIALFAIAMDQVGEIGARYGFPVFAAVALVGGIVWRNWQLLACACALIPGSIYVHRLMSAGTYIRRDGVKIQGMWSSNQLPWTGLTFTNDPVHLVVITPDGHRVPAFLGRRSPAERRQPIADWLNEIVASMAGPPTLSTFA